MFDEMFNEPMQESISSACCLCASWLLLTPLLLPSDQQPVSGEAAITDFKTTFKFENP